MHYCPFASLHAPFCTQSRKDDMRSFVEQYVFNLNCKCTKASSAAAAASIEIAPSSITLSSKSSKESNA